MIDGGLVVLNATSYWVAFADAAQLRAGVNDTAVALLAGVGPAGTAGGGVGVSVVALAEGE